MTIQFNTQAGTGAWGAVPMYLVYGAEGGPGTVVNTGSGLPVAAVTAGDTAAGSSDTGTNPVKIGGLCTTTIPTSRTTGQRVDGWFGVVGQLMVSPTSASSIGDGA